MDTDNLNVDTSRKDVQDRRLGNISRLNRNRDDAKQALNDTKNSVQSIERELSSFGPITVDQ